MKRMAGPIAIAAAGVIVAAAQPDVARNPLAADPSAAVSGGRVYEDGCVSCHGVAGQGDRGPALNTGRFVRGGSDADLFRTIREGVPGTPVRCGEEG